MTAGLDVTIAVVRCFYGLAILHRRSYKLPLYSAVKLPQISLAYPLRVAVAKWGRQIGYGMDGPGFESQSDVRTNPDSASLRGVKLPEREVDKSLSSSAECIYPSAPLCAFMTCTV